MKKYIGIFAVRSSASNYQNSNRLSVIHTDGQNRSSFTVFSFFKKVQSLRIQNLINHK